MKINKFITLLFVSAFLLPSCSTVGKRYEISDYVLETAYKDNYRILQLSDLHLGDKDDLDVQFKYLNKTIELANPDMIITTGDLFTFAGKATAKKLFKFLDSHEVPWTVVFGNHDEQCYFSIDWMTSYLNNFGSNCLFKDIQDDDVNGNCNFAINLMDGDTVKYQLIMMDSNRYYYGSYFGYDFIKQNQIDWYERLVNHTADGETGDVVSSLLFQHIPLPEVNDAWEYGVANNAIEFGEKREKSCPPDVNSGFFNKIQELGSTIGIFFGHDHVNNFRVMYENVYFCYGAKSTDRIYHDDDMMGGHIIILRNDNSLAFDHVYHTYEEVN